MGFDRTILIISWGSMLSNRALRMARSIPSYLRAKVRWPCSVSSGLWRGVRSCQRPLLIFLCLVPMAKRWVLFLLCVSVACVRGAFSAARFCGAFVWRVRVLCVFGVFVRRDECAGQFYRHCVCSCCIVCLHCLQVFVISPVEEEV